MGKRRRGGTKWERGKLREQTGRRKEENDPLRQEKAQTRAAMDIDEDCVQYNSGSEDGGNEQSESRQTVGKRKSDDMVDSDSDGSESSEEELGIGVAAADESDVEVGLEFFDPTEADVTPASVFLEKFCYECAGTTKEAAGKSASIVPMRDLATAICNQTRVGTMIRVTNEEAPIGFISCLNMHVHHELLEPIRKHLLALCGKNEENARFRQLLHRGFEGGKFESSKMGIILCERVLNLPPQIVPKMLEALSCEIEWATEDEPSEMEREAFRLGWYLYITEVYSNVGSAKDSREAKRRKEDGGQDGEVKIAFARVEDEAWFKVCNCHISWDVAGLEVEQGGFRKRRMAMIIAAGKFAKVREMVEGFIGSGKAGDEEGEDGEIGNGAQASR